MSKFDADVIVPPPTSSDQRDRDAENSIRALQRFGQSVWLDDLRRSLFTSGEFKRLIDEDGLRGVTSNPSIFEKAIAGSTDYLSILEDIERHRDLGPRALSEAIGTLIADPQLCRRMGAAGRERMMLEFTLERMAERVESVYRDILDS